MLSKKRLFPILVALLVFTLEASQLNAKECASIFKPIGGSSVELEMRISPSVMSLITTRDGTVGGLYMGLKSRTPLIQRLFGKKNTLLPQNYLAWALAKFPNDSPLDISWSAVPYDLKISLINRASSLRDRNFYADRKIPNLKITPQFDIVFFEPTRFLGKDYPRGTHTIDLSKSFENVEYQAPSDLKGLNGVELHIRDPKLAPSDMIESAWALQDAIGTKKTHLHEHIVAPIPMVSLKTKPQITILSIVEFYRRANLLAELVAIDKMSPIQNISKGKTTFFGSIDGSFLSGIYEYLESVRLNREERIGSDYKMGYVGFRGADTYDQPGLYGFEYRSLAPWKSLKLQKKIADAIMAGLAREDYGFTEAELTDWSAAQGLDLQDKNSVLTALEDLWYGKTFEKLSQDPLNPLEQWMIEQNRGLMMLLHDWSKDPLYTNDPQGADLIQQEQKLALSRLKKREAATVHLLRDFIWRSGLMDKVLQSFKIDRSDVALE